MTTHNPSQGGTSRRSALDAAQTRATGRKTKTPPPSRDLPIALAYLRVSTK